MAVSPQVSIPALIVAAFGALPIPCPADASAAGQTGIPTPEVRFSSRRSETRRFENVTAEKDAASFPARLLSPVAGRTERASIAPHILLASTCIRATDPLNSHTLAVIRSRHAAINRELRHYQRVMHDLPGYSTEGGSLTLYSLRSSPRKLVAQYYGETGRASEEYYYWNNQLFFMLRTEFQYNKPFGQVVRAERNRFYLDRGRLIGWINPKGQRVPLTTPEARDRERQIIHDTRDRLALARSKTGAK